MGSTQMQRQPEDSHWVQRLIDAKSFRAETWGDVLSHVKIVYHGISRVCVVWCSKVDAIEHEGQGIDRLRAGNKLNQK